MSSRHHFLPSMRLLHHSFVCFLAVLSLSDTVQAQKTTKPVLHGKHWVAITGKPLAATAGGDDLYPGWQCSGRGLRDVGGHIHHVGHAGLGR